MKGSDSECLILVLLEMGLSFAGIVSNLVTISQNPIFGGVMGREMASRQS
jgi:hypothetical protein